MRVCDTRDLAAAARAPLARLGVMPRLMRTFGIATTPGRHRWALRGIWIGPRRCNDGGGSSEPLAHVGEGVEVLVGGTARSHYDPVVYRSTRAPNLANAVSAWMATPPVIVADLREAQPHAGRELVLPIRVGGVVVVMDHKRG